MLPRGGRGRGRKGRPGRAALSLARYTPPVRPRPSTLAAAASAVLCVGVCGLWVRSYRVADMVGGLSLVRARSPTVIRTWSVYTRRGSARVCVATLAAPDGTDDQKAMLSVVKRRPGIEWDR